MEERAGCFTLIGILLPSDCLCSVPLPYSAVGLSVIVEFLGHTHLSFKHLDPIVSTRH